MRKALALCTALLTLANPVQACELALVLAIDVSSSVDAGEYNFQVRGLADALRDPEVADILLRDEVALSVVQWSGVGEQEASIPWRRMVSRNELNSFIIKVEGLSRKWDGSNTALGDAIVFSVDQFAAVPDCTRKVIDVSGDGGANVGANTGVESRRAGDMGIQINGIAIDIVGRSITEYYKRFVITSDGFVVSSRGFSDYPKSIKNKLLRELVKPTS